MPEEPIIGGTTGDRRVEQRFRSETERAIAVLNFLAFAANADLQLARADGERLSHGDMLRLVARWIGSE